MSTLTEAEKVDIRRFCGYPTYNNFGWVYEVDYSMLETRMKGFTPEEEAVVRTIHLPRLATFEAAINGVSDNLDTDVASVWTHNKNEAADRFALFNRARRELCSFIGIKPGRGLGSGSSLVRG